MGYKSGMTHQLHDSGDPSPENDFDGDGQQSAASVGMSEQTLKMVVITLGALLVIGFAVVVGTILYRLINMSDDSINAELPTASYTGTIAAGSDAFGSVDIARPAGMELKSFTVNDGVIYAHFIDAAGYEIIRAVRLGDGLVLGTINISNE